MLAVLLIAQLAFSQVQGAGWQDQVRQQVEAKHL
jgi:hypothetical protein